MKNSSPICFDTIRITQGVERKHFQNGQQEMGGTRFESFEYNLHAFGQKYSCECYWHVVSQRTLGET